MAHTGSKVLFLNHASLNVDEMLFLRAAIFLLVLVAIMNKDCKHYLTVEDSMRFPLAVRCASGTLAFFCFTTAIKDLPIILVALFQNTVPLFTSLFGFIILKEKMAKSEIFCLFLAFFGVFVLISSKHSSNPDDSPSNIKIWPLIMCVLGPMLQATTNICLRHMKGLHELTVSTYLSLTSTVVYGLCLPLSGSTITAFGLFSAFENFILIFVALAGGIGMVLKTKAFKYEKAGRLSMLTYLTIVFTFLLDLIFIGTSFNTGEAEGILIILGANLISAYVVYREQYVALAK